MTLRAYQEDAKDRTLAAFRAGWRRLLVCMATGLGKTPFVAALAECMGVGTDGGVALVCAHVDELLEQARRAFARRMPLAGIELEKAAARADARAAVVIASIQTLREKRLDEVLARYDSRLRLVVIDEAHRSAAASYRALVDAVGKASPQTLIVGVTATPQRTDKVGLVDLYDEIVYHYDLHEAIEDGYLVPPQAYRVETAVNLDGVRIAAGDFAATALGRRVNTPERNDAVVQAYVEVASGKRGLTFAASVTHAQALAHAFRRAGIAAQAVWGAMPRAERADCVARFRRGDLQMLVGVQLLVEGFDVPGIEAVVLARPTTSGIVYRQSLGRGLRVDEKIAPFLGPQTTVTQRRALIAASAKPSVVVLDVVDLARKQSVLSLPALFGLPSKPIKPKKAPSVRLASVPKGAEAPLPDVSYGETVIEPIDLFTGQASTTAAIERSDYVWHEVAPGVMRIDVPAQERALDAQGRPIAGYGRALAAARRAGSTAPIAHALAAVAGVRVERVSVALEVHLEGAVWQARVWERGEQQQIARALVAGEAVRAAERWLRDHYASAAALARKSAPWRSLPVSGRQRKELERRGLAVPATRGEANDLLSRPW